VVESGEGENTRKPEKEIGSVNWFEGKLYCVCFVYFKIK
jgi:hypothetical protein